jgi:hypothetical protein
VTTLIKTSGRSILVPPGLSLKPTITATIPVAVGDEKVADEDELAHAQFRLEYSATASRYEIASFGIDRRQTSVVVTGALWRTIRVHETVRSAIEIALPSWTWPITALRSARKYGSPHTAPVFTNGEEDELLLAALAYRIAEVSSETPALAVAETLALKQRTATNWIQRSRASGYMTSSDHQREGRRIAKEIELVNPWATPRTPEEAQEDLERLLQLKRKPDGNS